MSVVYWIKLQVSALPGCYWSEMCLKNRTDIAEIYYIKEKDLFGDHLQIDDCYKAVFIQKKWSFQRGQMGMKILHLNMNHTRECITVPRSRQFLEKSVADPDFQLKRVGEAGRSSRPLNKEGGGWPPKNFFSALRASFRSKNKVGPGPPDSSAGSATENSEQNS